MRIGRERDAAEFPSLRLRHAVMPREPSIEPGPIGVPERGGGEVAGEDLVEIAPRFPAASTRRVCRRIRCRRRRASCRRTCPNRAIDRRRFGRSGPLSDRRAGARSEPAAPQGFATDRRPRRPSIVVGERVPEETGEPGRYGIVVERAGGLDVVEEVRRAEDRLVGVAHRLVETFAAGEQVVRDCT